MTIPFASVIINNYNYGRFLARAIDSALQQSYKRVEVIVVDDGSTDNSERIINGYGERIIPCLKENSGQGSAFNAGFSLSKGEIVCFLDADDELLPTAVEQAVLAFESSAVVHVHWPLYSVDAKGNSLGEVIPYRPLCEGSLRDAVIKKGVAGYVSSPASGNAWARHYLQQVLPMPEAPYPVAADSYVAMLAPLFGKTRRLEQPQSLHRVHGLNSTFTRPYEQTLALMEYRLNLLADVMQQRGIVLSDEPQQWRSQDPYYGYVSQMVAVGSDLANYVPPGEDYILIDLNHWSKGELLANSQSIPFLEKDGLYWGPPESDQQAIAEFERLRQSGAHYLVLAQPAFWWCDHYAQFYHYLKTEYRLLSGNAERIIFDCRGREPTDRIARQPQEEKTGREYAYKTAQKELV